MNLCHGREEGPEVPVLQSAIQSGALSVSKARKIAPVLTLANQDEWVEKA